MAGVALWWNYKSLVKVLVLPPGGSHLALQSNSSLEHAQRINIAVSTRLFLSEVPELLNLEQYEERGIYQFELLYSDELDDRVGIIDHVEITWDKMDVPDGSLVENTTT